MKKLTLFVVTLFLFNLAFSQEYFKTLTEKYADKEGFSASLITRDMFNMYLKKKQVDEKSNVSETLKSLDNILIVSQSGFGKDTNDSGRTVLHKEILNHYKSDNSYSLFKTQKTMGEDLKVYLKKVNEKITSLAVVSGSDFSVNLVELNGVVELENLSDLGRELNLRGLENLYRINNNELVVTGYGLGTRGEAFGWGRSSGTWSVPDIKKYEEQLQLIEKNRDLSAEQRKKIEEQAKLMAEKQAQYAEQYRVMAEKYKRSPIFLSAPGDTNVIYYLNGKKVTSAEIRKIDPDEIQTIDVRKNDDKNGRSIIKIITKNKD
jgi:hypothetical protein